VVLPDIDKGNHKVKVTPIFKKANLILFKKIITQPAKNKMGKS